jgi:iron complex outermembrane receptor protein
MISFPFHNKIRHFLFFVALFLSVNMTLSFAQTSSIAGAVTDNHNEPAVGAIVVIEENGKGTQTDVDGKYKLENVEA